MVRLKRRPRTKISRGLDRQISSVAVTDGETNHHEDLEKEPLTKSQKSLFEAIEEGISTSSGASGHPIQKEIDTGDTVLDPLPSLKGVKSTELVRRNPFSDEEIDHDDQGSTCTNITNETPIISNTSKKYNPFDTDDDTMCTEVTPKISNVNEGNQVATTRIDEGREEELQGPIVRNFDLDDFASHPRYHKIKVTVQMKENIQTALIVIFFFISLMMSCYASLSCKFFSCFVGFKPENFSLPLSEIEFGPLSYSSLEPNGEQKCRRYPYDFASTIINADSLWKLSRVICIMDVTIGFSGFFLLCTIFSMVRLNESTNFLATPILHFFQFLSKHWRTITLGYSTALIFAEAIKFSFLRVNLCTDEMWLRDGKLLSAEKCTMSTGAYCTLWAIVLYFFIVVVLLFGGWEDENNQSEIDYSDRHDSGHIIARSSHRHQSGHQKPETEVELTQNTETKVSVHQSKKDQYNGDETYNQSVRNNQSGTSDILPFVFDGSTYQNINMEEASEETIDMYSNWSASAGSGQSAGSGRSAGGGTNNEDQLGLPLKQNTTSQNVASFDRNMIVHNGENGLLAPLPEILSEDIFTKLSLNDSDDLDMPNMQQNYNNYE